MQMQLLMEMFKLLAVLMPWAWIDPKCAPLWFDLFTLQAC